LEFIIGTYNRSNPTCQVPLVTYCTAEHLLKYYNDWLPCKI